MTFRSLKKNGHQSPSLSCSSPLLLLPPELIVQLSRHLPYPDRLALRLAHPAFYHSALLATDAAIALKVSWLCDCHDKRVLSAKRLGGVRLRTDAEFLANPEVRAMLRRRRRHEQCPWSWPWPLSWVVSLLSSWPWWRQHWGGEGEGNVYGEGGCLWVKGKSCGGPLRFRRLVGIAADPVYEVRRWEAGVALALLLALGVYWIKAVVVDGLGPVIKATVIGAVATVSSIGRPASEG